MAPLTNGDLNAALTTAKAGWAECAAKVDMVVLCQDQAQRRDVGAQIHE